MAKYCFYKRIISLVLMQQTM